MRIKDEDKVTKIYRAAIKVVNSDGFEGSSMAKIAAEANVSPATIYLYFENKEDMIKKLYIHLKSRLSSSYYSEEIELTPSKGTFRSLWLNHYQFIVDNKDEFSFLENFSNCPLINKIEEINKLDFCSAIDALFDKSRSIGILHNLKNDLLFSMLFSPINHLVKKINISNKQIETSELIDIFEASWRAIAK
ncbi:MAG: TetR/AcrR family transcriptional regulator [Paludibacter sp.]